MVPAQRELVHSGAYAFMRHPVYTGILLTSTAFVLRAYSPLNVLLMGLGVFWFIPVKSLVEENFLCRPAICRLHAASPRAMDSICDLSETSRNGRRWL